MKSTLYAHVRIGACDMAIPAAHVEQAIDVAKARLTPLPRREGQRCGALVGVVDYQGGTVPVVALDRWVPLGEPNGPHDARYLVMRSGRSLIAIRVDALMGVKRVVSSSIQTVCHESGDEELFEAVAPATAERPLLCLLEVARLMALAAAWCESAELAPGPQDAALTTDETGRERPVVPLDYAVFTIGGQRWAMPASAIAKVEKTPKADLRLAGQRVCGIGSWAGRKVPFFDLGFAHDGAGSSRPWMAVVSDGQHAIGVVVDSCDCLLKLADDEICLLPGDELRTGTALLPGLGRVSVLDLARLFDAVPEASISKARAEVDWKGAAAIVISDPKAQAGAPPGSDTRLGEFDQSDYLVFNADRTYAAPLNGLIGVTMLSASAVDDLSHGRRATADWRGETVAVVNMPQIDGGKSSFEPRLAIVVSGAGNGSGTGTRKSAIAVRSLTRWLPARSAHRSSMRIHSVGEVSVITPSGATRNESLVVVDLTQMAYMLD